jgi:hypothetical protein
MSNLLANMSSGQLKQAINIKEQIEALESKLAALLGGTPAATPAALPKKRTMSAAGRARIAAAQRARWAKLAGKRTKATAKPRRQMSPKARKRLSQLAKARWAKAKAAGKATLKG